MNAAWYQRMSVAFVVLLFISPAAVAVAQPAIIATISPPPNEFGWNNTPVVVSFYCQRALDCPAPLSIHAEGLRQLVRSSVTDADGRTASVSIEISIEFSAPKIAILTPESGFETRRAAIDVHAHVTRSIAEIAIATCNGDRVPVLDSDAITCLSALRDGINDVVVQITDRAGNSASTGIQIHRVGTASSIIVVPDVRT
ncbi:MAG TPA: hypothetical protein VGX46_19685, partial [Vicinamibacterales bacterium]|nr:hypothetical protein [Vicinamibacterales bacterium]